MCIYKLKIFLFSIAIIFIFGCLKQNSDTLSTSSSKNYLLVQRGKEGVYEKKILNNQLRTTMKTFFADRTTFKMKYDVTPGLRTDDPQEKPGILYDIKDVSSKLDANSTFAYFYFAHGKQDGSWCINNPAEGTCKELLYPIDLIEKIEEGRTKNGNIEPFKRLIIMANSCYSEEFMLRFQQELATRNEKNKPKLFEEVIYIASSYSHLETNSHLGWNILAPILFLLRAQQIARCNGSQNSYQLTYDSVVEPYLQEMNFEKDDLGVGIKATLKVLTPDQLIKDQNPNLNEKNPTFNDLALIIEKLNANSSSIRLKIEELKGDLPDKAISINISFSKTSLRNEPIFPPIRNCQL